MIKPGVATTTIDHRSYQPKFLKERTLLFPSDLLISLHQAHTLPSLHDSTPSSLTPSSLTPNTLSPQQLPPSIPHSHSSRRRTSRTRSQNSLISRQAHLKRDLSLRAEESAARIIGRRASGRALRGACRRSERSCRGALRAILLSPLTFCSGILG